MSSATSFGRRPIVLDGSFGELGEGLLFELRTRVDVHDPCLQRSAPTVEAPEKRTLSILR